MSRLARLLVCAALLAACGAKEQEPAATAAPAAANAPAAEAATPNAPAADAAVAAAPKANDAAAPAPAAAPVEGEFDKQGQALFRVAACGGEAQLPEQVPAKVAEIHCAAIEKIIAEYKSK